MERCKLVVEGAAAAPVGALLHGLVKLPPGSRVVAVLSGGNVNLDQLARSEVELSRALSSFEQRGDLFWCARRHPSRSSSSISAHGGL